MSSGTGQQGVKSHDGSDLLEHSAPQVHRLGSQAKALIVGAAQPARPELLAEYAELSSRTFCSFPRELSSGGESSASSLRSWSGVTDHHFHAEHGPHATPIRSPASESRPTHRGRDRRHQPRSPPLDGAGMARRAVDGRGLSGRGGSHRAGPPTGGPQATATRAEAHGTAPARAGRVAYVRVPSQRSASAGRTRQAANPTRG